MRLQPIEKPKGFLMKIAYAITKKRFGKVISPLKFIYARLPFAFSIWSESIHLLEKKLPIPMDLLLLIRTQVAQLNTCSFCIDIGIAQAMQQFAQTEKFFQLPDFADSSLFSEAEKAALCFATELTQHKEVSPATYELCRRHFSEEALVGISWVVATEHIYNLMNHSFEVPADGLCKVPVSHPKQKPSSVN